MSTSTPGVFFELPSLGLPTSQSEYLQIWLQSMQAQWPSYEPHSASAEYVQAQIMASWAAANAQLCAAGATELFRQYLLQELNLPYQIGTPAQAIVTINAVDTTGYTLPAGTQVTLTLAGTQVGFSTATTLTIANGSTSGNVTVLAVLNGTAFNTAGAPAALVSQIDWVQSVTIVTPAADGVDQQDDDQYVAQGAQALQLLGEATCTAADFASRALEFVPAPGTDQQEVGRATAIDGYDPFVSEGGYQPNGTGTGTGGNWRECTVCVTDASGNALSIPDTYNAVGAYLQTFREVSFIVNVIPPAYSTIYVTVTVKGAPGAVAATVQASVQAALLAYLNPANFALPQGAIVGWNNQQTIYLSAVEAVIQNTPGVLGVPSGSLAVGLSASPGNTTADVTLPGSFPLPLSSVSSIPTSSITVI